jgi:hypothetical protein
LKSKFLLTLTSIFFLLVACGREPYLIGEVEEVSREEIILSVEENHSKINEIDRVIITQKTLMDFTFFQKGTKVKVTIYEDEFNDFIVPPKVPMKDIELIK